MMSDPDLRQFRLARQQLELKRGKIRLQMDQRRWDKLQEEDEAEAAEADGGKGDGEARYERTVSALATRFGISRTTMAGLTRAPDAPRKHGKKGYLVPEWGVYLLKRRQTPVEEQKERKLREENIREIVRARKRENDAKEGKIISREEHREVLREVVGKIMDAVRAFPQRVAMLSTSPELRDAAEGMLAEVLHEIAGKF